MRKNMRTRHLILTKKNRKIIWVTHYPTQTRIQWVYSNPPINITGGHFTSSKPKYHI